MRMMFAVLNEICQLMLDALQLQFVQTCIAPPRVCPNDYSDSVDFPLCHHQVKVQICAEL